MHTTGIYPEPDHYNLHHKLPNLPNIKMRVFSTVIVKLYKNIDSWKM
jgi:hypothetical protein